MSVVSVVCCQVEISAHELITRPEESYGLWCVVVCDLETKKFLVNEEEATPTKGGYRTKRHRENLVRKTILERVSKACKILGTMHR